MKIKHMVYILLLFFALVPLLIFGLFSISENDKRVRGIMRENLAAISGSQILDIKNFCEARKERLDMLAHYEMVHDAVRDSLNKTEMSGENDKAYLKDLLAEWKSYSGFVESMSLIDKNYKIVESSSAYDESLKSQLGEMKAEYLDGNFHISNVIERDIGGESKKVLAAINGIWDHGELIGYVVEEISLTYFDKYREDTNLWKDGTLYLLDEYGSIITAGTKDEDSLQEFVTTEKEREEYTKAWQAVDLEENPSGEISYRIGGDDYVTYYAAIEYTDWTIKITVNISNYLGKNITLGRLMIISAAVVTVLLLVLNFFVSNRLSRMISNVSGTLKKIQSEQDYSLRIDNTKKNEIGDVVEKVNELLDYIERENIQEKERQRYLARKAEQDPLTGVMNKRAIEERLQDMLRQADEEGRRVAVAFVDIDDFKEYNTKYGHQEGDSVLQFVASVLEEHSGGIVGRNGGDEFVFGLGDVEDTAETESRVQMILKILNDGTRNRETGQNMPVPCSIGIVVAKGSRFGYSFLLRCADEAMYDAKQRGKNGYRLVERELS